LGASEITCSVGRIVEWPAVGDGVSSESSCVVVEGEIVDAAASGSELVVRTVVVVVAVIVDGVSVVEVVRTLGTR